MPSRGPEPKRVSRLDRLSALIAGLVCAVGCSEAPDARPEAAGRVVAVKAPTPAADLDAFCDAQPAGATLADALSPVPGAREAIPADRPVWLNVWATWCAPCKEELPFVLSLRDGLPGHPAVTGYAVRFLSVDDDDPTVERYRQDHPEMPDSLRVDPGDGFDRVLTALGTEPGGSIPVQVFAGSGGAIRCIRKGTVERHHLPSLAALLSPG